MMRTFTTLAATAATFLALAGASLPAYAEMSATAVTGDSRLVEFEFDDDNVFLVITRPKRSTFLRFGSDERITYVSAGDTRNFAFPVSKSFEFMEVKPKFENLETNVTVVTTKRTYHLIVRSTVDGGKWYARVTWKYPQVALLDLTRQAGAEDIAAERRDAIQRGVAAATPALEQVRQRPAELDAAAIERLYFEYAITGEAGFRPVRVMDDGKFTYITMPRDLQELPAVFRSEPSDPSQVALVNYEVKDGTLIAHRLMERFVLKLGKDEVTVERKRRGTGTADVAYFGPNEP